MSYKDIVKLTPALQAAALADYNARFAKKKKKKARDFLEVGFVDITGVAFIDATGDFI